MLPKSQKLTWKDINYMLKRGKRVYGKLFTFRVIPQYPQRKFNQWGIQIPLKVVKRASMRNMLKRAGYAHIQESNFWSNKFYKIFVVVNKKHANHLIEHIASQNKSAILQLRTQLLAKDVQLLSSRV